MKGKGRIVLRGKLKRRKRRRKGASIRWGGIFRLFFVIAIVACTIYISNLHVKVVQVEGNTQQTSQEIENLLLGDKQKANPLLFYFRAAYGKQKELPYVDHYTVTLRGIDSVKIEIHERVLAGYLDAMGTCLYFDKSGRICDSSTEPREDIPLVTGISATSMVVGDVISNVDSEVFRTLVNMTQFMQKKTIIVQGRPATLVQVIKELNVDSEGNVTCVFGDISVYMGSRRDMEEKMLEMADILPRLVGRRGTLYLDTYKSSVKYPTYRFKDTDRLAEIEADRKNSTGTPSGDVMIPGAAAEESLAGEADENVIEGESVIGENIAETEEVVEPDAEPAEAEAAMEE